MDKYFGFYRGVVKNNQDPENRNRITVVVPQILGQEETSWAWPCVPPAVSSVGYGGGGYGGGVYGGAASAVVVAPDIGRGVWITFEGGDINYPIWIGVWS